MRRYLRNMYLIWVRNLWIRNITYKQMALGIYTGKSQSLGALVYGGVSYTQVLSFHMVLSYPRVSTACCKFTDDRPHHRYNLSECKRGTQLYGVLRLPCAWFVSIPRQCNVANLIWPVPIWIPTFLCSHTPPVTASPCPDPCPDSPILSASHPALLIIITLVFHPPPPAPRRGFLKKKQDSLMVGE